MNKKEIRTTKAELTKAFDLWLKEYYEADNKKEWKYNSGKDQAETLISFLKRVGNKTV